MVAVLDYFFFILKENEDIRPAMKAMEDEIELRMKLKI